MRRAPPTVPGVPTANSKPPKLRRKASCTTEESVAPAPTMKRPSSNREVRKSRPRAMATPPKPSSATSTLEPRPTTTHGTFPSAHTSTRLQSAPMELARTKKRAGPPIR